MKKLCLFFSEILLHYFSDKGESGDKMGGTEGSRKVSRPTFQDLPTPQCDIFLYLSGFHTPHDVVRRRPAFAAEVKKSNINVNLFYLFIKRLSHIYLQST